MGLGVEPTPWDHESLRELGYEGTSFVCEVIGFSFERPSLIEGPCAE